MDTLYSDFDNLKISALTKSISINQFIHNVTIGPNSTYTEETKQESPKNQKNKKPPTLIKSPTLITNKCASRGKLLTEIEAQVKDEIETNIRSRFEKIQDANKQLDARLKSEWLKQQESRIAQSQQQEQIMMKMLEEHDRKSMDHMQKLQQQYRLQDEERTKRNNEIKKREEEQRKLLQLIESFQKAQHLFRIEYQEIAAILKEYNTPNISNDPTKYSIVTAVSQKLRQYAEIIDKIKEKCKNGSITNTELNIASNIVKESNKLKENMQLVLQKKKEEEAKQEELRKNPPQIEQPPSPVAEPEIKQPETVPTTDTPDTAQVQTPVNPPTDKLHVVATPSLSIIDTFSNKQALKMYTALSTYLETYKNSFAQLLTDPRMKQFRFNCQKAVNIPLNAISAVNIPHMMDKYQRLSNLLRGNNVEAGGATVSPAQHPLGIAFCTDLLARKFVQQGDLLISSNADSAHCYAAVLVALWHDFPDFGRLVLAYFYQTVPYLVPFYPPKLSGQSDQEYYISLGYNFVDGAVEKQDKFLKRMSGTMRLYAALTISKLKRGQQGPHPHGLMHAWRWIVNVLNLEPRSDITAQLIVDFLEVAGSSMQASYGKQFQKLLMMINDVYLEKMRKLDTGGPVTRLEVILDKIKKQGLIDPPNGLIPDGFW